MYSIVKVTTDNNISILHVKNRTLSYEDLDRLVSGSAEIVRLSRLPDLTMIVNDNGYSLDLALNIVASGLYGSNEYPILGDVYFAQFYALDPVSDDEQEIRAFDLLAGLRVKAILDLLLQEYRKANLL